MDMNKKYIPWILLTIRTITFVPIILSMFNVLSLTILEQVLGACIIITSDIFDGKISRKYNNEKDKLRFRLSDTIVDKTGIFSCMMGLLVTGKISISYFTLLLGYNVILLTGGTVNLIKTKNKEEKTVQGLFISRLFTALTGISIILLNNVDLSTILSNILTLSMTGLGISSLSLQIKDKLKQKETKIQKEEDKVFNNYRELKKIENLYLSKRSIKSYKKEEQLEKKYSEKDKLKKIKEYLLNNNKEEIQEPSKILIMKKDNK